MNLPDQLARTRIRTDLDTTLVVEAAAGTGKTTELVERIVAVVETGRAALHEVVAVTFTEKAAGELRLRLRARLEERLRETDRDLRARLEAAIAELEVAHIGTIHSLCADILKERPIEARVDPRFEVLGDGGTMERLYARAFDAWFNNALGRSAAGRPPPVAHSRQRGPEEPALPGGAQPGRAPRSPGALAPRPLGSRGPDGDRARRRCARSRCGAWPPTSRTIGSRRR